MKEGRVMRKAACARPINTLASDDAAEAYNALPTFYERIIMLETPL
jgi:hypothetical protein